MYVGREEESPTRADRGKYQWMPLTARVRRAGNVMSPLWRQQVNSLNEGTFFGEQWWDPWMSSETPGRHTTSFGMNVLFSRDATTAQSRQNVPWPARRLTEFTYRQATLEHLSTSTRRINIICLISRYRYNLRQVDDHRWRTRETAHRQSRKHSTSQQFQQLLGHQQ